MSKDSSYHGLILAAGLSSRMGDFKPLMPFNGKTLIESTIDSMLDAGLKQIVIVLGHRGDEVSAALRSRYGKEIILTQNPRYKTTDMLESMKWGLHAMPHCKAFFLLPGDMPVVKKSTFLKLMKASPSDRPAIILPTLAGREKHPPLIDYRFYKAIMDLKGNGGLRQLWTQQADSIIRIPVDDEGVRIDLDTREDYEVCISRFCRPEYKSKEEIKLEKISQPVVKKDHESKMTGSSVYVGDYDNDGVLVGKMLRAKYARAKLTAVKVPSLPDGYYYVDQSDIPGDNNVNIVMDDTPVFARETVEYIGEPIGMVVGPDESTVDRILSEIEVVCEELEPVLDLRKADTVFFDYEYGKGDIEKAFAEADQIYEEEFTTGYQDQTYLETQGMMAEPEENGRMFVHGSLQCAYYVHGAVIRALGCGPDQVHIKQDVTGGGFGGKEAFPSILGCQVAVAAKKAGAPVRCIFDRREDLEFTSKRHPSLCTYKAAVKDGRVTAMDIDVKFNSGAYTTLSAVVLQRGIICANGIYNIENLHVHGRALKTNTTPTGAYRGFGAPQTFFAVEMMMDHIAQDLGMDSLEFKEKHIVKQGDSTSTSGMYHFPVPIPAMIEEIDKASDFRRKHKEYALSQTGRIRRGIGMSLFFHGAGFTGSGERDHIKAVCKLHKFPDGTVEILASNGEIGQGLRTTFPKIVANELNLPLDKVYFEHPDTARVPDSGPTVASRSLMVVGELLRRCAIKLRSAWKDGEDQTVEEHFKEPEFVIPFYLDKFQGDAYPTYSWGVHAIEVEVDTYTGLTKILGAYGNFDVGTPVDINIVTGQMEGGFLQGIGYASTESMDYDQKGRIRNNSFSDYLIPTAADVTNLKCMLHVEKYPDGPYGAKGAGELPLVGAPGAYVEAVEQALGHDIKLNHAPFTAEDIIKVMMKEGL